MLPNVVCEHESYKHYLASLSQIRKTGTREWSSQDMSPLEVQEPCEMPHTSIKAHAKHVNEVEQEQILGDRGHHKRGGGMQGTNYALWHKLEDQLSPRNLPRRWHLRREG